MPLNDLHSVFTYLSIFCDASESARFKMVEVVILGGASECTSCYSEHLVTLGLCLKHACISQSDRVN